MVCTVLPTFLSKVRACTVGSATGLAPSKGATTVAGLCRILTGFATTRRSTDVWPEGSTPQPRPRHGSADDPAPDKCA
jgi:hypothetical protein